MRVLVVYCHPCPESLAGALRDAVLRALQEARHESRLVDLYGEGFNPVLSATERRLYYVPGTNEEAVAGHLDNLRWAEGLVFIYPTWWYGLPAMLKGWLDRVWVPHATFSMPQDNKPIGRVLTNIRLIVAVTTLGCPRWLWWLTGMPGRRTLFSGIGAVCNRRRKTLWLAHYGMDSSTPASRRAFVERVERRLASL